MGSKCSLTYARMTFCDKKRRYIAKGDGDSSFVKEIKKGPLQIFTPSLFLTTTTFDQNIRDMDWYWHSWKKTLCIPSWKGNSASAINLNSSVLWHLQAGYKYYVARQTWLNDGRTSQKCLDRSFSWNSATCTAALSRASHDAPNI